jgi:hypothetical protein
VVKLKPYHKRHKGKKPMPITISTAPAEILFSAVLNYHDYSNSNNKIDKLRQDERKNSMNFLYL